MKKGDWLTRAINVSGDSLPTIQREVREMIREYDMECGGKPMRYISYGVSSRLIRKAALKAGGIGGLVAVPAALPLIGTIGTIIISSAVDLVYLLRVHIQLCYRISVAYGVMMDEEELKAVTLALLGLSSGTQTVKGMTAYSLRNLVDGMAEKYLRKGITGSAADVADRIGTRLLGRAYKIIPLIGIPVSASANVASTMVVGNQARRYFSTWDKSSDPDTGIYEKN